MIPSPISRYSMLQEFNFATTSSPFQVPVLPNSKD